MITSLSCFFLYKYSEKSTAVSEPDQIAITSQKMYRFSRKLYIAQEKSRHFWQMSNSCRSDRSLQKEVKVQLSYFWVFRKHMASPKLSVSNLISSFPQCEHAPAICVLIPQWGPFDGRCFCSLAAVSGDGSHKVDMNGSQPSPLPLDWIGWVPVFDKLWHGSPWLWCHLAGAHWVPLVSLNLPASLFAFLFVAAISDCPSLERVLLWSGAGGACGGLWTEGVSRGHKWLQLWWCWLRHKQSDVPVANSFHSSLDCERAACLSSLLLIPVFCRSPRLRDHLSVSRFISVGVSQSSQAGCQMCSPWMNGREGLCLSCVRCCHDKLMLMSLCDTQVCSRAVVSLRSYPDKHWLTEYFICSRVQKQGVDYILRW